MRKSSFSNEGDSATILHTEYGTVMRQDSALEHPQRRSLQEREPSLCMTRQGALTDTVHCCGSASGIRLTPYILLKGKYVYQEWTWGAPAGALHGISDSG